MFILIFPHVFALQFLTVYAYNKWKIYEGKLLDSHIIANWSHVSGFDTKTIIIIKGLLPNLTHLWILMQFGIRVHLSINGRVQNINSMPAMISKLQDLYCYPILKKKYRHCLGYFKTHALVYNLLFRNDLKNLVKIHWKCEKWHDNSFYSIQTILLQFESSVIIKYMIVHFEALDRPWWCV